MQKGVSVCLTLHVRQRIHPPYGVPSFWGMDMFDKDVNERSDILCCCFRTDEGVPWAAVGPENYVVLG